MALQSPQLTGITMIIRSLMGGGAERVMSTMANYWVTHDVPVTIITSVPPDTDAYWLHEQVKRIHLPQSSLWGRRLGFPWSIRTLRRQIRQEGHSVVLSFMDRTNIPVILATRGLGLPVVVAERIDPHTQHYPAMKRLLMRLLYPKADAVVVLTPNVREEWARRFVPAHKVHVIHNPVLPLDTGSEHLPEWLPQRYMVAMGRLHPQKGFDMLFEALPTIFDRWPDLSLVVLGDGENRRDLEEQIASLGLTGRVLLPGFVKHPHSIMSRAELFVLPSRFEGFPNALIEAMALGLPVVSFDCPSGPKYLIANGVNGLLVPAQSTMALTQSLCALLEEPAYARQLGRRAQGVCQACNVDTVMRMWTQLLQNIQQKNRL